MFEKSTEVNAEEADDESDGGEKEFFAAEEDPVEEKIFRNPSGPMSQARMERWTTFGARATARATAHAASSPRHAPETSQTPEAEIKPSRAFVLGVTPSDAHAASYARQVAASSGESVSFCFCFSFCLDAPEGTAEVPSA